MAIHLIGTLHYDFKGTERLREALRIEKPQILTLEVSDAALEYWKVHWKNEADSQLEMLRKNGFDSKTFSFFEKYMKSLSLYEVDTCLEYSREFNIPLVYVDDPNNFSLVIEEAKKQTKELFEKFEPDFFKEISIEKVQSGYDMLYEYFQKLYDGKIPEKEGEKLIDSVRGKVVGKRDEFQAKKIASIARENPEKKIVHVGGCVHFLSDSKGDTLYSKLKLNKLNPTRKTLWKYEQE